MLLCIANLKCALTLGKDKSRQYRSRVINTVAMMAQNDSVYDHFIQLIAFLKITLMKPKSISLFFLTLAVKVRPISRFFKKSLIN